MRLPCGPARRAAAQAGEAVTYAPRFACRSVAVSLPSSSPSAVRRPRRLRRWLAADPGLAELEVRPLSLEEAFVSLTQDPVAAGRLEQAA